MTAGAILAGLAVVWVGAAALFTWSLCVAAARGNDQDDPS